MSNNAIAVDTIAEKLAQDAAITVPFAAEPEAAIACARVGGRVIKMKHRLLLVTQQIVDISKDEKDIALIFEDLDVA